MTAQTKVTLVDFLLARIAEEDAPTYELVPYDCEPGCCAPKGWVGVRCFICDDGVIRGGTVKAMTQSANEHAEKIHQRSRVLNTAIAKRTVVSDCVAALDSTDEMIRQHDITRPPPSPVARLAWDVLRGISMAYLDHPDVALVFDPYWNAR